MSYKKFSRFHGKTARVKKYKWSNPDRHCFDSDYVPHNSIAYVSMSLDLPVIDESRDRHWGGRHSTGKFKSARRHSRRVMNCSIRVYF